MIEKIKNAKGFLFDLDGVFIQSEKSLPGAIETIKVLQARGIPFRFLTNTTTKSRKTLHMLLLELGIKCEQEHIFSAGYSGIKTIIEMGYPTCHLYISDDLKKDLGSPLGPRPMTMHNLPSGSFNLSLSGFAVVATFEPAHDSSTSLSKKRTRWLENKDDR